MPSVSGCLCIRFRLLCIPRSDRDSVPLNFCFPGMNRNKCAIGSNDSNARRMRLQDCKDGLRAARWSFVPHSATIKQKQETPIIETNCRLRVSIERGACSKIFSYQFLASSAFSQLNSILRRGRVASKSSPTTTPLPRADEARPPFHPIAIQYAASVFLSWRR